MPENSGLTPRRPRLFDRGFLFSSAAAVLLVACSGSLDTSNQPGTGGTGECGFGAGNCTGQAGTGECGSGAGNCAGTAGIGGDTSRGGTGGDIGGAGGDMGGSGGAIGGTGGATPLPACPSGDPVFGICIINDADSLPLSYEDLTMTNGPIAGTVVDVGLGTAPARCEEARIAGSHGTSEWWFQVRAADNHVWTIGVHGLDVSPVVAKNDNVTLEFLWFTSVIAGFGPASGRLQVSSAAGTPLLWAAATAGKDVIPSWIAAAAGDLVCDTGFPCDVGGHDVVVTVNGVSSTLSWFSGSDLGGYRVRVGKYVQSKPSNPNSCQDYYGVRFDAAAAKLP